MKDFRRLCMPFVQTQSKSDHNKHAPVEHSREFRSNHMDQLSAQLPSATAMPKNGDINSSFALLDQQAVGSAEKVDGLARGLSK